MVTLFHCFIEKPSVHKEIAYFSTTLLPCHPSATAVFRCKWESWQHSMMSNISYICYDTLAKEWCVMRRETR